MKREQLDKLCATKIVRSSVPEITEETPLHPFKDLEFAFTGADWDVHSKYGIAGQIIVNGDKYRHGILFDKPEEEITPEDIYSAKQTIIKHLEAMI